MDIQDRTEEIKSFENFLKMNEKRNSFEHMRLIFRKFVELGALESQDTHWRPISFLEFELSSYEWKNSQTWKFKILRIAFGMGTQVQE